MLSSQIPSLVPLPFANSGTKNAIPTASQIGVTPGAASLTDGFPPLTFTPIASGGIPPAGADFNGILNLLSANTQWENAGGFYPYSASFSTSIGGYPKGALLIRSDSTGFWLSTTDNNTLSPETDTTGAWFPISNSGITSVAGLTNVNVTLTSLQYAKSVITLSGALTGNVQIIFPTIIGREWLVVDNTTGAFTVTCKTAAGTGFITTQGAQQFCYGDGTNIVLIQSVFYSGVQGTFKNLQSSATGLSATVTVTADEISVENGSSAYVTLRAASLSINSAGAGANGLDTGTLAASTWYSVWVIWNGTTAAGLVSLSTTAPTMPSGYTHKARVGWIFTDGSVNKYPLSFTQYGRRIQLKIAAGSNVTAAILIASGVAGSITAPTWVAVAVRSTTPTNGSIPPTASKFIGIAANDGSGNSDLIVAPNNAYGAITSGINPPPVAWHPSTNTYGGDYSKMFEFQVESANIYWASAVAANKLYAYGWEDNL